MESILGWRFMGLEGWGLLRQYQSAGNGARAKLQAIFFGRLQYSTSMIMLLRLFSTLVAPAISYECEIWDSRCLATLDSNPKSAGCAICLSA